MSGKVMTLEQAQAWASEHGYVVNDNGDGTWSWQTADGARTAVYVGGTFDEYAQQRMMPLPDAHPSQWAVFVDYQLTQPHDREAMENLKAVKVALGRYTATVESFAGWWAKQLKLNDV